MTETVPGAGRLVAGRYRLAAELGRGGMGVVWLADDTLVGRQVAIKELRSPPGLAVGDRELFATRALAEARNAACVQHPGAVTLHDVIAANGDDATYLVMELIRAPTLAAMIASHGPLGESRVISIGLQLLDVLEAAHALGVVHRDVKPANIMIADGDQAKLADFGIAQGLGDPRLTRSGVMGTQAYLAPELFEGKPITPAADLWSLGATLYYATAGTGPFDRDTTAAILRAILIEDLPAPPCRPSLATAISALLSRDPARRATSQQARSLLQQTSPPPPPRDQAQATSTTNTATGSFPGPPPRPEWERNATTRTPGQPGGSSGHVPPRAAALPPQAGIARFSSVPGAGLRTVLALAFIAALLFIPFSLGVLVAPLAVVYCILAITAISSFVRISAARWRVLTLNNSGIAVTPFTTNAGKTMRIRWDQVTMIGPVTKGSVVYLGIWGVNITKDPGKPLLACPLGTPHFPRAVIREAIARFWPMPNLDPDL
jgi:serine/threonine protein kinase